MYTPIAAPATRLLSPSASAPRASARPAPHVDRFERCAERETFLAAKSVGDKLKELGRKIREKGKEVERKVNEGLDDLAGGLFPSPEPIPVPIPIPVDDRYGRPFPR
ncbi:MAG: hypothetical protein EB084_10855 [Proteobacteria bacterium]|nr:hypothetical protein [Pseudomonadota bacterium]